MFITYSVSKGQLLSYHVYMVSEVIDPLNWQKCKPRLSNGVLMVKTRIFRLTLDREYKSSRRKKRENKKLCQQPDLPVAQHYKATMSAYGSKSVPILI